MDVEQVPVIHVKNLEAGQLQPKPDLKPEGIPRGPKLEKQQLESGDILVSARGTLLKCAVIRSPHVWCVASANFIMIRLDKDSRLHPELLCAYLRQSKTQSLLMSKVSSTAQPALNIGDIKVLCVEIPDHAIQANLVNLLRVAEEQYCTALELAELLHDDALSIVAEYMEESNA
ncbi:MAG: restriction endonuclease subunit S [Sulfitobacter sp.]